MARTTATTEEYLEIIYMVESEGRTVKGARLAQVMQVSRPTVTATLRRLTRDGFVKVGRDKSIALTKNGLKRAEELQRRHRIVERWLTDVLKLDWAESDAEAHRLEHAMSDRVTDRLNELLGFPPSCPHGNPIPGNRQKGDVKMFPLSQASEGDHVRVVRISEYAENTADMLRYLGEHGLRPDAQVVIADKSYQHGTMTLRVGDKHFALTPQVADFVWVAAK
jgi:DtxR family transcriptional regulator, iron-dependent repressor